MLAECSCVLELRGEDTFIEALDQHSFLCHNELLEQLLLFLPHLTVELLLAVKERATINIYNIPPALMAVLPVTPMPIDLLRCQLKSGKDPYLSLQKITLLAVHKT